MKNTLKKISQFFIILNLIFCFMSNINSQANAQVNNQGKNQKYQDPVIIHLSI
jgi:hypothetical protein